MRQLGRYASLGGGVAGRSGEQDGRDVAIVLEALDGMRRFDAVLELASGTGWWTQWLAQHGRRVTAVDAAEEMVALNRERVKATNVKYIAADIFAWKPNRKFDLVFFAFWLSHVPHDRFAAFWRLVGDSLAPHGRVFFVDELDTEEARGQETRVGGDAVLRTLEDGRLMGGAWVWRLGGGHFFESPPEHSLPIPARPPLLHICTCGHPATAAGEAAAARCRGLARAGDTGRLSRPRRARDHADRADRRPHASHRRRHVTAPTPPSPRGGGRFEVGLGLQSNKAREEHASLGRLGEQQGFACLTGLLELEYQPAIGPTLIRALDTTRMRLEPTV